jgi:hypothetical protein
MFKNGSKICTILINAYVDHLLSEDSNPLFQSGVIGAVFFSCLFVAKKTSPKTGAIALHVLCLL